MPDDTPTGSKSLTCACGFSTSLPSYMLAHLSEGNCQPSDAQSVILRSRLSEIHTARMALTDRMASLELEQTAINAILRMSKEPVVKRATARPCQICGTMTKERRGKYPQCPKHEDSNADARMQLRRMMESLLESSDDE